MPKSIASITKEKDHLKISSTKTVTDNDISNKPPENVVSIDSSSTKELEVDVNSWSVIV